MSVERKGGDQNIPSVQRRGEKNVVLPVRKTEAVPSRVAQDAKTRHASDRENAITDMDVEVFEARVRRRVLELEADPLAKKAFLKKMEGWFIKIVLLFIVMIAFPPFIVLAIPVIIYGVFVLVNTPRGVKTKRVAKMHEVAEALAVAAALKNSARK